MMCMQITKFLSKTDAKRLYQAADVIRNIAIDAVQIAGSGHMGTPLGCAELGAYLFGSFLRIHPKTPKFPFRDRFLLSAGHASLLIYSGLYLCGYPISHKDLAKYRQLNSITPSHPEINTTIGVDASSGLDGQSIGHAAGMALAGKMLPYRFENKNRDAFDYKVIALAGDGCFMEGISAEASSMAGHLCLNNLIVIYDSNKTSLDGYVSETFSEDVKGRYLSYGWEVIEINGNCIEEIHSAFASLRENQTKPCLVIANTQLGKGVDNLSGHFEIHSGPISKIDADISKKKLGASDQVFEIPNHVQSFFLKKNNLVMELFQKYRALEVNAIKLTHSNLWTPIFDEKLSLVIEKLEKNLSGREISHKLLQAISDLVPEICAGSADLARSDRTFIKSSYFVTRKDFSCRNIKFGVREFAMGAMATGLALSGLIPVVGTFLAFSDYMKSAIRMTAQMQQRVIFHFTHDSFLIGHDGPTHQPIEQLMTLRAIPGLQVIRPADHQETLYAWRSALAYPGPTALVLARQELAFLKETNIDFDKGFSKGAYLVKETGLPNADVRIFATGSELSLALEVAKGIEKVGLNCLIASVPCWELFSKQSLDYRNYILGSSNELRVSIEAGSSLGWERFTSNKGISIAIDCFGKSGSPTDLREEFGFTTEKILKRIISELSNRQNSTKGSTSYLCKS